MKHSPKITTMQLRMVKPERRYTIYLVGLASLCTGWLFMYYLKTNEQIEKYQQEISTLVEQNKIVSKAKAATTALATSVRKLKSSLSCSSNNLALLTKEKRGKRMTTVAKRALKEGLKLHSCTAEKKKNKGWLKKQSVAYNMTGSAEQISNFVSKIETETHLFKCKSLAFNNQQNNNARLECTLQFLTFEPAGRVG
ncbi:type 4a pilus biogenesis protein PilO [Candidatus Dependentiae bacterium]